MLSKWKIEKMVSRKNGKYTKVQIEKWQKDKMTCNQSDKQTKWQIQKKSA